METIKINNKFIINKYQKEFFKNKVFSNYFRMRILSMVLVLLDLLFLLRITVIINRVFGAVLLGMNGFFTLILYLA